MLTSQSSYSDLARRLSEIASQQAATAKGMGLTQSALGFESMAKQWEGYAGENVQGNGFGRVPQIINSPNELTYLNSYGQNNPFSWGIPGNGPKSGGAPLGGGGDNTVYNEYGGTSALPTLWGNNSNQYGEAQGGSQYLESQPWGQQGNPGPFADTQSAIASIYSGYGGGGYGGGGSPGWSPESAIAGNYSGNYYGGAGLLGGSGGGSPQGTQQGRFDPSAPREPDWVEEGQLPNGQKDFSDPRLRGGFTAGRQADELGPGGFAHFGPEYSKYMNDVINSGMQGLLGTQ